MVCCAGLPPEVACSVGDRLVSLLSQRWLKGSEPVLTSHPPPGSLGSSQPRGASSGRLPVRVSILHCFWFCSSHKSCLDDPLPNPFKLSDNVDLSSLQLHGRWSLPFHRHTIHWMNFTNVCDGGGPFRPSCTPCTSCTCRLHQGVQSYAKWI